MHRKGDGKTCSARLLGGQGHTPNAVSGGISLENRILSLLTATQDFGNWNQDRRADSWKELSQARFGFLWVEN